MRVGLINFNRRGVNEPGIPPVPPIGLEYLIANLTKHGHISDVLDLCFVDNGSKGKVIKNFLSDKDIIGITLRNIDLGCYLLRDHFYVPELKSLVKEIKETKDIPVVLGGAGFSSSPKAILEFVGADYGISGPGEVALCNLLHDLEEVPHGAIMASPPNIDTNHNRSVVDFEKYIMAGGTPAIQTKTGCTFDCNYCIEAKSPLFIRNIDSVIDEIKFFTERGTQFIYFADSEFNIDINQAEALCERIIEEGLDFTWSTYLSPRPLTKRLVKKMKAAGCVNPCICIDSGDNTVLQGLNKKYDTEYILEMASWLLESDLPYTVDLVFGGVNDTLIAATNTIRLMEIIRPSFIGMNYGIRIYKNTRIWRQIINKRIPVEGKLFGQVENNDDFLFPIFYIFDIDVLDYLKQQCRKDPRYKLFGYQAFAGINYKIVE